MIDEAGASPAFAKRVNAALAATKGPAAVAALVDRRLAALERARGFVDREKARGFTADLDASVKVIVDELGAADPAGAIDRLLRFLASAPGVFDRVDDSNGRVQAVYHAAVAAAGPLTARLSDDDKAALPARFQPRLAEDPWRYLADAAVAATAHLPPAALAAMDAMLACELDALGPASAGERDWNRRARIGGLVEIRKAIADRRGDVDGWIALETGNGGGPLDTLAIARRLLTAGRPREALDWVRRPGRPGIGVMDWNDRADGNLIRRPDERARTALEAGILEALGDHDAAQSLRWRTFEGTLDLGMLREHVARLPDFAEFETLDRAFVHAAAHADIHRALALFLEWPRLDLAAKHVIDRRDRWDGRNYGVLAPAAETLEADHPAAATVLLRALVDDVLKRAQSTAYGHAARYLERLDALAPRLDPSECPGEHAAWRAAIAKAHARKSGFWAQVRARGEAAD